MVLLKTSRYKGWAIFTGLSVLVSAVGYVWYSLADPLGPRGGSWAGIAYGTIAYALMLFAGFLALRKRVRTWPLGKATFWMNGHLWLGSLAVPLVLFHTGFQMGAGLGFALMILFAACILTGIYGLALQQFLPRIMLKQVRDEAIYDLIPDQIENYRNEADGLVEGACGPMDEGLKPKTYLEIQEGFHKGGILIFEVTPRQSFSVGRNELLPLDFEGTDLAPSHFVIEKKGDGCQVRTLVPPDQRERYPLLVGGEATESAELFDGSVIQAGGYTFAFQVAPPVGAATLKSFYREKVRPFLEQNPPRKALDRFATELDVINCFDHSGKFLAPGTFHETCRELCAICEERRQLIVQQKLHRWLHGWLVYHVPVSIVLIVLVLVHAFVALYY